MKIILIRIISLFSFISIVFSESPGATFLLIPPSPTMNGLGGIGVCLPSYDPYSSYFNPANGLNFVKETTFSHSKMTTPWLKNLGDSNFEYEVWNFGMLLSKIKPIKFVGRFHKTFLNSNLQNSKAYAFTFGVGHRYNIMKIPVDISSGFTTKLTNMNERNDDSHEEGEGYSTDMFFDIGLLLASPYSMNLFPNTKPGSILNKFDVNLISAFGYSVSNIGRNIDFIDADQAQPAPKYLRTGISFTTNISYKSDWNLIEWRGGRSASDALIKSYENPIKYQNGFGDVNFIDNVIMSNSDPLVIIHRGFELTLFDYYTFRKGRKIDNFGHINLETIGCGYNSDGMFKLISFCLSFIALVNENQSLRDISQTTNIIPKYINIRYNYSEWNDLPGHPLDNTEFESWLITFRNIDRLIAKVFK